VPLQHFAFHTSEYLGFGALTVKPCGCDGRSGGRGNSYLPRGHEDLAVDAKASLGGFDNLHEGEPARARRKLIALKSTSVMPLIMAAFCSSVSTPVGT